MNVQNLIEMNNVGIVVDNLDNCIEFFNAIGLALENRMYIDDEWAGKVTGIPNQKVEIAMMVTPDSHGRIELTKFHHPAILSDHRTAEVNSLGYLRIMFRVRNLDEMVIKLQEKGYELVGEMVNYENVYRLCYIRGAEGILVGFAERLTE